MFKTLGYLAGFAAMTVYAVAAPSDADKDKGKAAERLTAARAVLSEMMNAGNKEEVYSAAICSTGTMRGHCSRSEKGRFSGSSGIREGLHDVPRSREFVGPGRHHGCRWKFWISGRRRKQT